MNIIEKKKGKEKVSIALEGEMTIFFIKELKDKLSGYLENIKKKDLVSQLIK